MSSVFSRKITMSTFSGCFTGLGTPWNHRTGRRHTYRSRIWRSATLSERMPPPTGVVSGPLIPMRYSRNVSTVSSGSQLPVLSNAFWPARTSFQEIVLPCFLAAASSTSCAAGQMSTPVPSPSMKGMIGSSGTLRTPPPVRVIFSGISFLCVTGGTGRSTGAAVDLGDGHEHERDHEHRRDGTHHGPQGGAPERGRAVGTEAGIDVALGAADPVLVLGAAQRT